MLLSSAGFREPDERRAEKDLELPPPADFLWQYLQSTPIGAEVFNNTDADARSALEAEVREGLHQLETGNGMKLQVGVITASTRK